MRGSRQAEGHADPSAFCVPKTLGHQFVLPRFVYRMCTGFVKTGEIPIKDRKRKNAVSVEITNVLKR